METSLSVRLAAQTTATLLVIVGGIAAVVARGTDGGTTSSTQYLKMIQASSSTLTTARSVDATISEVITENGVTNHLSISIDADRITHDARSTVYAIDGSTRHLLHVGNEVFARVPSSQLTANDGKPWAAYINPPNAVIDQLQTSSGVAYLRLLAGARGSVSRVGPETVNGLALTKYDAHVDATTLLGPLLKQLAPSVTDAQLDSLGFNNLPVQVWLDDSGVARQISLQLSADGATAKVVGTATPSTQAVVVTPPASAKVNVAPSLLAWAQLING